MVPYQNKRFGETVYYCSSTSTDIYPGCQFPTDTTGSCYSEDSFYFDNNFYKSNYLDEQDLKEWTKWQKILESREQLRLMWMESIKARLVLVHVNEMIQSFRNRRILNCNRRGIGLRLWVGK